MRTASPRTLRKAPIEITDAYISLVHDILDEGVIPAQWKQWTALLAMKKGEDPRDLSRRRDLWLAPHAVKLITRCLTQEYAETVLHKAPASNAGFCANACAPSQTLTLKLHRARCRRLKQTYLVGFQDLGCYFMSCCREVQGLCEEWAGVRPEVIDVMAAFQRGLKGKCETAYGLTGDFAVDRGIMQGCIASPARSLLQLRFMAAMVHEACRGYRFREKGVPMAFYCDDGAWLAETPAALQMAFDASAMAARIADLDVTIKESDRESDRGTKTAWMGCYYDRLGT